VFVGVAIAYVPTVALPDHEPAPYEAGQVVRGVGLRELGAIRDLADAQRSVREGIENPEARRLTQTVEELLPARTELPYGHRRHPRHMCLISFRGDM
jgi:hypothetical protein